MMEVCVNCKLENKKYLEIAEIMGAPIPRNSICSHIIHNLAPHQYSDFESFINGIKENLSILVDIMDGKCTREEMGIPEKKYER